MGSCRCGWAKFLDACEWC